MGAVEDRLNEMGIKLPPASAPAANYMPFQLSGDALFISGQLPMTDGKIVYSGTMRQGMDEGMDMDEGIAAARLCAINILAQVKGAIGNFERISRCVRLGGFVNAAADFTDHPKIINGASDLMVDALGERGRHTRFAVGASSLPLGALVEIEALFHLVGDN